MNLTELIDAEDALECMPLMNREEFISSMKERAQQAAGAAWMKAEQLITVHGSQKQAQSWIAAEINRHK